MSERSRFLLNGMLGKLARWLRILGYDATYLSDAEDTELLELARQSGRTLLTRDKEVRRKAIATDLKCVYLENADIVAWLSALKRSLALTLDIDSSVPRCTVCNAPTESVDKASIQSVIPTNTSKLYSQFWRCTSCGKVYWQGSHWRQIRATVQRVVGEC